MNKFPRFRLTRNPLSRVGFSYPAPRKLREIMQMSLIEKESPNTVKHIWDEYHAKRPENVALVSLKDN